MLFRKMLSICMIMFRRRWIPWALYQINKQLLFLQEHAPYLDVEVLVDTPYPELVRGYQNANVIVYDSRLQDIGTKRNILVKKARGSLICMLDDDNWYANYFAACSLRALQESRGACCVPKHILCMELGSLKLFRLSQGLCEGAMVATKEFLVRNKFKPKSIGEGAHLSREMIARIDGLHAILINHGSNVCRRDVPSCAKDDGLNYFDSHERSLLVDCLWDQSRQKRR